MLPSFVASALVLDGPPPWGSPVDLVLPSPAECTAALIVLVLYFLVAAIVVYLWSNLSAALVAKLLLVTASVTRGSHSTNLFLLAAGVALLYGGEFFEVIRFMDPEAAELEPAEKEYVQQLAAAVVALEQWPLVTKVSLFDKPGNLNETGVRVNLDSAFVSQLSRRQFQSICSEKPGREGRKGPPTAPKPTQLHAVRAAHAKLLKDYEDELAAAAAAAPAAPAEQTACDVMMAASRAASVARRGLEGAANAAAATADAAQAAERAAGPCTNRTLTRARART